MIDQQTVTKAIGVAKAVARGDDAEATEATVRLARVAGVDAIRLLHNVVRDDRALLSQRVRASCVLLETAGLIGGTSSESKSSAVFRDLAAGNGVPRDAP
jgi:hypothetical protein